MRCAASSKQTGLCNLCQPREQLPQWLHPPLTLCSVSLGQHPSGLCVGSRRLPHVLFHDACALPAAPRGHSWRLGRGSTQRGSACRGNALTYMGLAA
eukprot:scaffold176756_cov33-Tisochrysis_lutea.AAC.2